MNLANCPRCGKLFSRQKQNICPNCFNEIEKEYQACVTYLKENKNCTLQHLSDETEVSIRQITQFIREGRINISNNPNMGIPCDSCGELTRSGSICDSCRDKLQRDMRLAQSQADSSLSKQNEDNRSGGAYQIGNRLKDR
jgi:flagellar operon protein (TIGR03826 family)